MSQKKYNDGWMATITGKVLYPMSYEVNDVDIEDIAHANSLNNRYSGMTPHPYSVNQHSILIAQAMLRDGYSNEYALCGLLHDAHEIMPPGDLNGVLKKTHKDDDYVKSAKALEYMNQEIYRYALGLTDSDDVWNVVASYDVRILVDEKEQLFKQYSHISSRRWGIPENTKALDVKIENMSWEDVRDKFLEMYKKLEG